MGSGTSGTWHSSHPISHNNSHHHEVMLAQKIEKEERAIHYLRKRFLEYETWYTTLETTSLALVWATKVVIHYILIHIVHVITLMDPIRYLIQQLVMRSNVARWIVMPLEFDVRYISQKSIKGRAMCNFLVDFVIT